MPSLLPATVPSFRGTGRGGRMEEGREVAFCVVVAEQRRETCLEPVERDCK